ncbi:MAG: hypothetical protein KAX38_09240 [Candidatus Krumholzibacteria bacterium]|nr:hypothetical protein [Candidatus Krumholzibacteria bacterium]
MKIKNNESQINNNHLADKTWITENEDSKLIILWREAMSQLRQMHGDTWNGVKFFLTISSIILAAIFACFRDGLNHDNALSMGFLASLGIVLTIIAILILHKHRKDYVEMLLKKTLLELKLGFYK